MRTVAAGLLFALLIDQPSLANTSPCPPNDSGVTNEGPGPEELAYIAQRFALVCHTRRPELGMQPLRLFTEPRLDAALKDGTMAVYVDMFVDQMVRVDGVQFLGGTVVTTSRCPLVQRYIPDGQGGGKQVVRWFMLASDLACDLKQPGVE